VAAVRAAFVVVRDKQDPERRLLLPLKNNLGPDTSGMAYRIEEVGGVPKVVWEEEPVLISADDALRQEEGTDGQEMTLVDSAAEWLQELLADGPVASKDVELETKAAGYSWATVRRARAKLNIKPRRMATVSGESTWHWALLE
jgi:hypothetical protein